MQPDHRYICDGYLKKYAGARHVHYGVEAVLKWLAEGGDPVSIDTITLEIYSEALTYCGNRAPKNSLQAQFSLTYAIAHAMTKGHHPLPPRFRFTVLRFNGLRFTV